MANDFHCPYCKGKLNIDENIVLSARTHEAKRGLVCLSPKLGNYVTRTHQSFKIPDGERAEFFCPICHSNLAALELDENLVKVMMTDDNHVVYEILFSGIAGEECTYKLKEDQIESFGGDSHKYRNFFGEFPKY